MFYCFFYGPSLCHAYELQTCTIYGNINRIIALKNPSTPNASMLSFHSSVDLNSLQVPHFLLGDSLLDPGNDYTKVGVDESEFYSLDPAISPVLTMPTYPGTGGYDEKIFTVEDKARNSPLLLLIMFPFRFTGVEGRTTLTTP